MAMNGRIGTVFMSTDTVGGVWTYSVELARSLAERGVRVVLASMGPEPSASQRQAAEAVHGLVLESRPYKLEWMTDPWDDVDAAGEWLLDLEGTYQPDVIHLNSYVHGALPWSAPVLVVGHSCVWSWFHAVRGEAPPSDWMTYRARVASGIVSADVVAAPTRAMLSQLRRHYGRFKSAKVVYNARRTDSLKPLPGEDFVMTAGRLWDEAKNTNVLDAAAASIGWPVFAAGAVENPDGGEVRFKSVQLLGELSPSDLGRWMGRASIYVLPARYEPFGLTALEAAHAGCALVLGDIASLREIWQDAAVFVPPNDGKALAEAVNGLIADRRYLNEMALLAALKAAEFTVERMAGAYLEIYTGMLSALEFTGRDRPPLAAVGQEPSSKSFDRMIT